MTAMPDDRRVGVGTWVGFSAMTLGMFMAVLDIQIVVTSLPEISEALDIAPDKMSWVQTAYLIAEVIAIPVLALMAWEGFKAARETLVFNDVTSDLSIHRLWYWIPVLIGLVGSAIAAVAMLVRKDDE